MSSGNDPTTRTRAAPEATESVDLDFDAGPLAELAELDQQAARAAALARGTALPAEEQTKVEVRGARSRPARAAVVDDAPTSRPSHDRRNATAEMTRGQADSIAGVSASAAGPTAPDDRIGRVLGPYRLLDLIGKGGMGYVYRAEHVKLGREVALKLLRDDYAKRRDAVARFFQEARTVNKIRHRNIVDVTDFIELGDGTTFIIMELLRGKSLTRWAREPFDLATALAVLIQICDGLAAAHAIGVIHRDLKPDNIVVGRGENGLEVKLLDFGVAKLVNRHDEDVGLETAAGSVIGTPAYMSPEQAGGMSVDDRSDIYSLGAIMYELFTGQPMFRGRSFGEFVRKHLSEYPPPPRSIGRGATMSEALEAVIVRALAKDPNLRYGSILELREHLVALLAHERGGVPDSGLWSPSRSVAPPSPIVGPIVGPVTGQAGPGLESASAWFRASQSGVAQVHGSPTTGAKPKSALAAWILGGAVAIGVILGGVVYIATRGDRVRPVAQPAPEVSPMPHVVEAPVVKSVGAQTPAIAGTVTIRFDSSPRGASVRTVGGTTELCRTPCAANLDGAAPGAAPVTFVLSLQGHEDAETQVPLDGSRPDVVVALKTTGDAKLDNPSGSKLGGKSGGKLGPTPGTTVEPKVDLKPDPKPDPKPDLRPDLKPDPKPDPKVTGPDKRPGGGSGSAGPKKIERTDTIDPFASTPR